MTRKVVTTWFGMMAVLLLVGVAARAQVYDFEDYNIGDAIHAIGWGGMVAEVADDPLATGNNVLKFTPNNYNAAPVLEFTLPAGKTLADYPTFTFKGYFAQGDVAWKYIVVEAYQTKPTAQAYNNSAVKIGEWNRATGAATAWENFTINIAGSSSLTGTIYIAFGINCSGTGGGATTIWYADDVDLGIEEEPAANYVTQWGSSGYAAWPITNTASTPGGSASMGKGLPTTSWASLRGAFSSTLTATTTEAVVVTGKMEFIGGGGGDAYTPLRVSLTYQDSVELKYQYTDSAAWKVTAKVAANANHYGYLLCPMTGLGTMSNTWRTGAQGTIWTVPNGNWVSTNNVGAAALAAIKQAPRNAELIPGVYNFAISVQDMGDGTNEVRWYMVEVNNKYWFGGTVIDTAQISGKFNGIIFGVNSDNKATQFNVNEVKVDIGAPIEVPEAPWQAFYVNQWGKTSRGKAWPVLNDSTYLDGDASMGNGAITTDWSSIRGGFGDPVEATTEKAIIVSGQLEYVGGSGGSAYTHLRYALTYQDSIKLNYQYTDSAMWVTTGKAEKGHYGYGFHPISGMGVMSNGNGGAGTLWQINGGTGWNSTWSNNGVPIAAVKNAPRNAEMIAGVYNWAISVRPLGDGTNEVRWSLVHVDKKSYWFGGTAIDKAQLSTKFNGICFSVNKDNKITQFNVYEVKVDIGAPIEVPEAPWQAYYVTDWGFSGGNLGGWTLTPGEFDGDATIGGTAAPTGWSAVRGGLDPYVLTTEQDRALIVTGKIELVGGGFQDLASLRYGLFYSDSAGTVKQDANLDSNWVWSGTDRAHSGYLFTPPSGANVANWSGVNGTWGSITNGTWWDISSKSTALGAQLQTPASAVAGPGTYAFAISISAQASGNLVRATLTKADNSYQWESSAIVPANTGKINCVAFAINNSTTTALNLIEIQVDRGPDIITEVADEEIKPIEQLPTTYALSQNYPNPFNPTTTIEFALPQSSEINLVVFDISGRVVAELAKGKFVAGYHKFNFDATNLATGVYFVKLKAGNFVSVNKAVLVK